MSLGTDFRFQKTCVIPGHFPGPACSSRRELRAVPAAMPLLYSHGRQPSGTLNPIKCFLLEVDMDVVSYHSKRKISNIPRQGKLLYCGPEVVARVLFFFLVLMP